LNNSGLHIIRRVDEQTSDDHLLDADSSGEVILKMVNGQPKARTLHISIPGVKTGDARMVVMSADPAAENSLDEPTQVSPVS
jgi:alpha-L-arabinofuranosidase